MLLRRLSPAAMLLALTGCGASELTRLETEQRALETEVATLRQTVEDLRGEMQRKGVIRAGPGGPRPKAAGALAPENDLSLDFTLEVTRSETDRMVRFVSQPEVRSDTACGWRVGLQHLESIADFTLAGDSLGRSSPLVASIDDVPLVPHSAPSRYADACDGAFRHQSKYLFYSPPKLADGAALQVVLSEELPIPDEEGRPRYWVYPGTTLTITASGSWDAEAWGAAHLVYDLRLRNVGLPNKPNATSSGAVTLALPDAELTGGTQPIWRGSEPLTGSGPWTITISSPSDGPFVLVDGLAIGNGSWASVVTSKQHDGGGE